MGDLRSSEMKAGQALRDLRRSTQFWQSSMHVVLRGDMSRTISMRYLSAVFCLLLLIFASANVFGQQLAVAQLSGHAVDPSGAALPDATVRMIETERGVVHTAKTNDEGLFVLPGLPVGPYRLEVSKTGFKTFV